MGRDVMIALEIKHHIRVCEDVQDTCRGRTRLASHTFLGDVHRASARPLHRRGAFGHLKPYRPSSANWGAAASWYPAISGKRIAARLSAQELPDPLAAMSLWRERSPLGRQVESPCPLSLLDDCLYRHCIILANVERPQNGCAAVNQLQSRDIMRVHGRERSHYRRVHVA